jgi:glycosyltransferase involved in cell wall biosynthesis
MIRNHGLVSVVIPAYNAEKYIKGSIESVIKQTYPYSEIIIVDDGSSDNTINVVKSINDNRIRLIEHTQNKGPGAARNTAISAAKGKWIALLDADDQWLPQRLEILLKILDKSGPGYFIADDKMICFDTHKGLQSWKSSFEHSKRQYNIPTQSEVIDVNLTQFINYNAPVLQPIIPIEHIRKFDLRYNELCLCGEDLEFYCHLFNTGLKLKLYNEPLYLQRQTPGSLSSQTGAISHIRNVYQRLLKIPTLSRTERQAIINLIDKEQWNYNSYYPFITAIKNFRLKNAIKKIIEDPKVLNKFFQDLVPSLQYRIALWRMGGVSKFW